VPVSRLATAGSVAHHRPANDRENEGESPGGGHGGAPTEGADRPGRRRLTTDTAGHPGHQGHSAHQGEPLDGEPDGRDL